MSWQSANERSRSLWVQSEALAKSARVALDAQWTSQVHEGLRGLASLAERKRLSLESWLSHCSRFLGASAEKLEEEDRAKRGHDTRMRHLLDSFRA